MTELLPIFERLGLQNYIDIFVEEGFDTWETVLDITESDLEALNVKLGHRRKLQKEIAHARGISVDQVISSGARNVPDDLQQLDSDTRSTAGHGEGKGSASGPTKRKYRRHPKADENAPERAPSAYVIFSNKVREELRPQKLSFTEIAKTVGERWQELPSEEKEQYESQASTLKEAYNAELARYKRTPQYKEYMRYLADFKAKNTPNTIEGKRLKLESEASNASSTSATSLILTRESSNPEHHRKDSLSQSGYSPSNSSVNSPTATIPRFISSTIESSQSSHPPTPVSAKHFAPGQSTQAQRSFEHLRAQHLPRILPLEHRDGSVPHRMTLANELGSSFGTNPRRSGTNSPASFLRHDTSKSSTSSNISGGSGTSATFTPITPVEDFRPSRSLPPPPNLLTNLPPNSQSLVDLARPIATSPTASKPAGEYSSATPAQQAGYPQSFHQLSITGVNVGGDRRSRSHSIHKELVPEQTAAPRSMSTHQTYHQQGYPERPLPPERDLGGQEPVSRMDSLSVLALAGRMVGQPHETGDRTEQ